MRSAPPACFDTVFASHPIWINVYGDKRPRSVRPGPRKQSKTWKNLFLACSQRGVSTRGSLSSLEGLHPSYERMTPALPAYVDFSLPGSGAIVAQQPPEKAHVPTSRQRSRGTGGVLVPRVRCPTYRQGRISIRLCAAWHPGHRGNVCL